MPGCLAVVLGLDGEVLVGVATIMGALPDLFWSSYSTDPLSLLTRHVTRVASCSTAALALLCGVSACLPRERILQILTRTVVAVVGLGLAILDCLNTIGDGYLLTGVLAHVGAGLLVVALNCGALMYTHFASRDAGMGPVGARQAPLRSSSRMDLGTEGSGPLSARLLSTVSHLSEEQEEREDAATGQESQTGAKARAGGERDEGGAKPRGWKRLLMLAGPHKRILFSGCIALLTRLPFSLAVPAFCQRGPRGAV
jgi:hypothetical protein